MDFGRKSKLLPIPKRAPQSSAFQSTHLKSDQNRESISVFDDLASSGYFNVSCQKVINYVNPDREFLVVFSMTFDTESVCV